MLWRKKARKKNSKAHTLSLIFRASFAGLCFAAFAIYAWGVEGTKVLELILFLSLVVVTMIVPAALFLSLIKLFSYIFRTFRKDEK